MIFVLEKVKKKILTENYYFNGGSFAVYHAFNAGYLAQEHLIIQMSYRFFFSFLIHASKRKNNEGFKREIFLIRPLYILLGGNEHN